MKVGDIVVVKWLDANSERQQMTREEALALPLPLVRTYGVLLELSKKRVTVAGEKLVDSVATTYRDVTVVPRGMVKSIHGF